MESSGGESEGEAELQEDDKKAGKSPAERMREYRRRKKELNYNEMRRSESKEMRTSKTPAEYMREYRQRMKTLKGEADKRQAKSPAERMREYRQRKKETSTDKERRPPKTPADYMREYRQRQKALRGDTERRPAKTPAEYMREYRQRKKALAADLELTRPGGPLEAYLALRRAEAEADAEPLLPLAEDVFRSWYHHPGTRLRSSATYDSLDLFCHFLTGPIGLSHLDNLSGTS